MNSDIDFDDFTLPPAATYAKQAKKQKQTPNKSVSRQTLADTHKNDDDDDFDLGEMPSDPLLNDDVPLSATLVEEIDDTDDPVRVDERVEDIDDTDDPVRVDERVEDIDDDDASDDVKIVEISEIDTPRSDQFGTAFENSPLDSSLGRGGFGLDDSDDDVSEEAEFGVELDTRSKPVRSAKDKTVDCTANDLGVDYATAINLKRKASESRRAARRAARLADPLPPRRKRLVRHTSREPLNIFAEVAKETAAKTPKSGDEMPPPAPRKAAASPQSRLKGDKPPATVPFSQQRKRATKPSIKILDAPLEMDAKPPAKRPRRKKSNSKTLTLKIDDPITAESVKIACFHTMEAADLARYFERQENVGEFLEGCLARHLTSKHRSAFVQACTKSLNGHTEGVCYTQFAAKIEKAAELRLALRAVTESVCDEHSLQLTQLRKTDDIRVAPGAISDSVVRSLYPNVDKSDFDHCRKVIDAERTILMRRNTEIAKALDGLNSHERYYSSLLVSLHVRSMLSSVPAHSVLPFFAAGATRQSRIFMFATDNALSDADTPSARSCALVSGRTSIVFFPRSWLLAHVKLGSNRQPCYDVSAMASTIIDNFTKPRSKTLGCSAKHFADLARQVGLAVANNASTGELQVLFYRAFGILLPTSHCEMRTNSQMASHYKLNQTPTTFERKSVTAQETQLFVAAGIKLDFELPLSRSSDGAHPMHAFEPEKLVSNTLFKCVPIAKSDNSAETATIERNLEAVLGTGSKNTNEAAAAKPRAKKRRGASSKNTVKATSPSVAESPPKPRTAKQAIVVDAHPIAHRAAKPIKSKFAYEARTFPGLFFMDPGEPTLRDPKFDAYYETFASLIEDHARQVPVRTASQAIDAFTVRTQEAKTTSAQPAGGRHADDESAFDEDLAITRQSVSIVELNDIGDEGEEIGPGFRFTQADALAADAIARKMRGTPMTRRLIKHCILRSTHPEIAAEIERDSEQNEFHISADMEMAIQLACRIERAERRRASNAKNAKIKHPTTRKASVTSQGARNDGARRARLSEGVPLVVEKSTGLVSSTMVRHNNPSIMVLAKAPSAVSWYIQKTRGNAVSVAQMPTRLELQAIRDMFQRREPLSAETRVRVLVAESLFGSFVDHAINKAHQQGQLIDHDIDNGNLRFAMRQVAKFGGQALARYIANMMLMARSLGALATLIRAGKPTKEQLQHYCAMVCRSRSNFSPSENWWRMRTVREDETPPAISEKLRKRIVNGLVESTRAPHIRK